MAFDRPRADGRQTLPPTTREVGGWQISATWLQDQESDGPLEVVLRPGPGIDPATARRGLTTGVMRQLEARLTEMTREHHQEMAQAGEGDQLDGLIDVLREQTPRSSETYYPALLDAYALARKVDPSGPATLLAHRLGVRKGTLTTRLDVARRRAQGGR